MTFCKGNVIPLALLSSKPHQYSILLYATVTIDDEVGFTPSPASLIT
jgi:hypothetical protein